MSVKGCEVSAVSWNFPRRHTNNTNCRSAVGAHRFIWHHRLQGQLEVINLQEGDSCVCVCVCVRQVDEMHSSLILPQHTHYTGSCSPLCSASFWSSSCSSKSEWGGGRGRERAEERAVRVCVCVCVMVTTCENAAARCLFTITWTVR